MILSRFSSFWQGCLQVWESVSLGGKKAVGRLVDILLGSRVSSIVDSAPLAVFLPLPEGEYTGSLTFFTCQWSRPRWPVVTRRYGAKMTVDSEEGQPTIVVSLNTHQLSIQDAIIWAAEGIQEYRIVKAVAS